MFNFVNFLRQKWTEYSSASGQKGTVVDELSTKPTGLILADFYNSLVSQQQINDITNWQNMSDDQMTFFGNKFFIPRVQGSQATGYIRIFFDNKVDIEIPSTMNAVSDTGLLYQPIIPSLISKNSMQISTDPSARYYIDILVQATLAGDNYNIDAKHITSLSGAPFTYKNVTNQNPISNGYPNETNAQYYRRLIYSINDRSLMNKRSLYANLKTYFPYVNSSYIAAPGDKYMIRDFVEAIDISVPIQKAEFLGKIPGDNNVNNSAYYGTYPPEAGSLSAAYKGPFSIDSIYPFPQSIEPINLSNTVDVGLHGYPLNQEATIQMYQGLYFDDYRNFMTVKTSDLFNIYNESIPLTDVIVPNSNWVVGANGHMNGDYGTLQPNLGGIDIIKFNNNTITLAAGSASATTAEIDIKKRIGLKLNGVLKTPSTESSYNSNLQFMIAGVDNNNGSINSYTGIGFGIRMLGPSTGTGGDANAIIYFAHSERYAPGQIFAAHDDFVGPSGFVSVASLNALAEKLVKMTPGEEYNFEFCIYDDLSLSLYLKKVSPTSGDEDDKIDPWFLAPIVLSVFGSAITNQNNVNYGTMMKVTLETKSIDKNDQWVVSDLKAMDIAEHTANALYIFDVQNITAPLTISFRGNASGSINKAVGSGYSIYIWDTSQPSPAGGTDSLSIGGWTLLDNISNPNGLKDSISTSLTQTIQSADQYIVQSRFGTSIILLVSVTGTSEAKVKAKNEFIDDIYSELNVDYIKIESEIIDKYHANNKTDIYVCTIENTENLNVVTTDVTKGPNESFFLINKSNGFQMPIENIQTVSVNIGGVSTALAQDSYVIIRDDVNNINSINETIKLSLLNNNSNSVTVQYSVYNSISDIQNFYSSTEYSKLFGNILVKHLFPCYLDINMLYTGNAAENVLIDTIKSYVDANNTGIFSVQDMISYLYNQNVVNNVQIPLNISYTQYNDDLSITTGTFNTTLQIRKIDFFRIRNITASKL